jgi:hypothetical protein
LGVLEGRWRAVRFVPADRETAPGGEDDPFVVTIAGGRIDLAGVATAEVTALDPATDPKCLDFQVRAGAGVLKTGSSYESVYKRDGGSLVVRRGNRMRIGGRGVASSR